MIIIIIRDRRKEKEKRVLKGATRNRIGTIKIRKIKYISRILYIILKARVKGTSSFCFHFAPAHNVPIDVLMEPFHVLYKGCRVMSSRITSPSQHFLHPHHRKRERERNGTVGWERRWERRWNSV